MGHETRPWDASGDYFSFSVKFGSLVVHYRLVNEWSQVRILSLTPLILWWV